eukprot:TRINITY_DN15050_c0_g2_i1.p1 TRINITY_DN15050_c0_g2~~TRINITY_DN15050_c0_g2_i1.p1  ORF type:complete len:141 (+),score=22.26 TRINITY_DN15050_c0_g2_i1:385-807(+)
MACEYGGLALGALIVGIKLRRVVKGDFASSKLRHHWLLVRITILNYCFFGGNLFCIGCAIAVMMRPGLSVYISTIQVQAVYQSAGFFVLSFLLWFFSPISKLNTPVFNASNSVTDEAHSNSIPLPEISEPSSNNNDIIHV